MKNLFKILLFAFLCFQSKAVFAQKPSVWIITDMTDPSIPGNNHMGTVNDPDDVSAMAAYLLMGNMFDTKGIVVGSTHRKEHKNTPNQAEWANYYFGKAYEKDIPQLNKRISGYPTMIPFMESCIKVSAEKFDPQSSYPSLEGYSTVQSLLDTLLMEDKVLNILCWGSLTEPAILVKHCLSTQNTAALSKIRIIAHWTNSPLHQGSMEHPENVANCREDAAACAFLKEAALNGTIDYYETGAIGQHGIVSGSPKGPEYFDQFKTSALGKIFATGKYVHDCVDHSDSATYWALLGNWGVSLNDLASNGINPPFVEKNNEEAFRQWSGLIHDEILRRSKAAEQ